MQERGKHERGAGFFFRIQLETRWSETKPGLRILPQKGLANGVMKGDAGSDSDTIVCERSGGRYSLSVTEEPTAPRPREDG